MLIPTHQENLEMEGTGNPEGIGNPVKIEGRGSTGRTTPNNLNEQMSMHDVQSNPLDGSTNLGNIGDLRWEGWEKHARNINGVEIHFNYDPINHLFDDFKFKP